MTYRVVWTIPGDRFNVVQTLVIQKSIYVFENIFLHGFESLLKDVFVKNVYFIVIIFF